MLYRESAVGGKLIRYYIRNGFVRAKRNSRTVGVADAVSSRYRGKISKRFRIGLRLCESSRTVAKK